MYFRMRTLDEEQILALGYINELRRSSSEVQPVTRRVASLLSPHRLTEVFQEGDYIPDLSGSEVMSTNGADQHFDKRW